MNDTHINNINKTEIPIITATAQLYKLFYKYLELFPKKDKYALGAKCEGYIIALLELLLSYGSAEIDKRKSIVRSASVKLDALKIFIRLCRELKILDDKKYLELQKYLQDIGKQIGGWMKFLS